jgi:hypothetical protein
MIEPQQQQSTANDNVVNDDATITSVRSSSIRHRFSLDRYLSRCLLIKSKLNIELVTNIDRICGDTTAVAISNDNDAMSSSSDRHCALSARQDLRLRRQLSGYSGNVSIRLN